MVGCPSCGAPDDQGCFKDCPETKVGLIKNLVDKALDEHNRLLYASLDKFETNGAYGDPDYWRAKMPKQKPGRSKQDYGTPPDLLNAVRRRLAIEEFSWDLAADEHNTVVVENEDGKRHFNESDNALTKDWVWDTLGGWLWLNPPFANINPWVEKAYEESQRGAHIVVLTPASFSEWWRDWVEGKCYVVHLQGRIKFVGCDAAYPKDCSLLVYTPFGFKGSEVWSWR